MTTESTLSGRQKLAVAAAAIVIIACAAGLRTFRLSSDPPHGLSVSRAEYTDEGLKYYQSRNRALFGQWWLTTPDAMQGPLEPSPVPTVTGAAVFKLFGAGRVEARMISVVSGVLSCLVLILIGVRMREPAVGLVAGALAAVNFTMMSYDRLALFESPMVLLCLTAAYFYIRGGWTRAVLAPVMLVLAYFTRAQAVSIAGALGAAFAAEALIRSSRASAKRTLVAGGAVAAALAVAVAIVWLLPHNQILQQARERLLGGPYYESHPVIPAAADLLVRTFADSRLASWMPVTLVLALLALAPAIARPWQDRPRPAFLFFWWFMAAFALVAFIDYRPTRYFMLVMPAACYLAADWLVEVFRGGGAERLSAGRTTLWFAARLFAGVQIAGVALALLVARRYDLPMLMNIDSEGLYRLQTFIETHFIGARTVESAANAAGAGAVALMREHVLNLSIMGLAVAIAGLGWRHFSRGAFPDGAPRRLRLAVVVALVFVILATQLALSRSFFSRRERRYEMTAAEAAVRKLVGTRPDACIGGNWAPGICMGTPYFTFPLARGNGNAWDTFKRFPVTHLLLEMGSADESVYMWKTYPEEMRRTKVLAVFHIDVYKVGLFEYTPPEGAPRPPGPFEKRTDK